MGCGNSTQASFKILDAMRHRDFATDSGNVLDAVAPTDSGNVIDAVAMDAESLTDYVGERNEAGEREGEGTYVYASGAKYQGEWKAGIMDGRGMYRHADGSVYEGEWKAGEKEGRGTYRHANGNVYQGEYKAGKREGHGTMLYSSGAVYEGEWKADEHEGCGTFRHAGGVAEVSRWRAGRPVGEAAGWTPDRRQAGRMLDGKPVETISLERAAEIADELGLPVPPVVPDTRRQSQK
jgi:hypothetical protein